MNPLSDAMVTLLEEIAYLSQPIHRRDRQVASYHTRYVWEKYKNRIPNPIDTKRMIQELEMRS
jgi:hypothetical protein